MAEFSFRLKGLQLFALILLWVLMSAGLFFIGTLVAYRNFEPEKPAPITEDAVGTAESTSQYVPPEQQLAPAPEKDLGLIYQMRTQTPATPFGKEIYRAASDHGVSPALVAAIVSVESEFDPAARSHKGAVGLMQVMPQTAQRFGHDARRLTEPAANLAAGSQYLKWLTQRYSGDLSLVLGGYNAGEGAIDRYGGIPPYPETRQYVRKVLAAFRSLDEDMNDAARIN